MNSPLLFLVFNRPETTRRVFEAIREARPPRLYVAADGPRKSRQGEAQRCEEVRRIATAVDWPCEVKTLFRDENLGCKRGVCSAMTWFFENEAEGVILEDDVLPIPTFFTFCDELLARYRDDERVAMITGCNLVSDRFVPKDNASYFFSRHTHIWGWACWRRSWSHFDAGMSDWPQWRDGGGLGEISAGSALFVNYWRGLFDASHQGLIDGWDYQWTFACWRRGALIAMPVANQTHNLGFGADATHTIHRAPDYLADSVPRPLPFPLIHPQAVARDHDADAEIERVVFGINWLTALKRRLYGVKLIRSVATAMAR